MKKCGKCGEVKPLNAFQRHGRSPCKACKAAYQRGRRDIINQQSRERRERAKKYPRMCIRDVVRFFQKVSITADGCWLWTGSVGQTGYGRFCCSSSVNGMAHKVLYHFVCGQVPTGMELDHTCRVRRCVNPCHLEPVTHLENMRRSAPANKKTCINGHPLEGSNLYLQSGKGRSCLTCRRLRMRQFQQTQAYKDYQKAYRASHPDPRRR